MPHKAEAKLSKDSTDALDWLVARANTLTPEQQRQFLRVIAAGTISLMRGTFDEEYVRGFLIGALIELDVPGTAYRLPTKH